MGPLDPLYKLCYTSHIQKITKNNIGGNAMADFEKAFDKFLDDEVHDDTNDAIFRLTRRAFTCGWLSAGGEEPIEKEIIKLNEYIKR